MLGYYALLLGSRTYSLVYTLLEDLLAQVYDFRSLCACYAA
jgi:hypothetical protein